jgi:hypothetical protein
MSFFKRGKDKLGAPIVSSLSPRSNPLDWLLTMLHSAGTREELEGAQESGEVRTNVTVPQAI